MGPLLALFSPDTLSQQRPLPPTVYGNRKFHRGCLAAVDHRSVEVTDAPVWFCVSFMR